VKRASQIVALGLSAGLLAGCARSQPASPTSKPAGNAQVSSATIPPANPPTTAPIVRAPATILINQKPLVFPPAVLQIRNRDGQLMAVLMSDDPKDAINEDYHGNSFYLEMPLELTDEKDLANYVYRYDSPSSDRTDSPNGIFLDGNRQQLQPATMQVKFIGDETSMQVQLSGEFLQFNPRDDSVAPKRVGVMAQLDTEVRKKNAT
jgi:hypothetical protein